jgi:hypothetical protein
MFSQISSMNVWCLLKPLGIVWHLPKRIVLPHSWDWSFSEIIAFKGNTEIQSRIINSTVVYFQTKNRTPPFRFISLFTYLYVWPRYILQKYSLGAKNIVISFSKSQTMQFLTKFIKKIIFIYNTKYIPYKNIHHDESNSIWFGILDVDIFCVMLGQTIHRLTLKSYMHYILKGGMTVINFSCYTF